MSRRILAAAALLLAALAPAAMAQPEARESVVEVQLADAAEPAPAPAGVGIAVFAGGCFWCMEPPFDKLDGVLSTTSGYTGGSLQNPTYEQVSGGRSGHIEAIEVRYDPARVDYATLLRVFWKNIDPVAVNRQFCDAGPQYRSAIFPRDAEQRRLAEQSLSELQASGRFDRPIATEILPAGTFWPAEDYHQDYYQKNPVRYRYYRWGCGRDQRLQELWGKS